MNRQPRLPVVLLLVLLAAPVQIVVHDLGRTALAQLAGDSDAAFHPFPWQPSRAPWSGVPTYDPARLSPIGQVLAPLGGLLFTQAAALGFLAAGARRPRKARTYLGAVGGVFLADVPVQVVQAVIADVGRRPQPDLASVMSLIYDWTGAGVVLMKAVLIVLSIGYCAVAGRLLWRRFRGRSWAA